MNSKEKIKEVKRKFKHGTRVKLVKMNDPYVSLSEMIPGTTTGTVKCVDDIGTIHVSWDNGHSLGIVLGEDECCIIE